MLEDSISDGWMRMAAILAIKEWLTKRLLLLLLLDMFLKRKVTTREKYLCLLDSEE